MDCGTDPQDTHRPLATDRSLSSDLADTGSPALHQTRRDSVSSLSSEAASLSDQPPPWTCTRKKGNFLRIRISLSPIKINQCQRNKTTETLCRAYVPLWVGPTSLKWTIPPVLRMITLLQGPRLLPQAKYQ